MSILRALVLRPMVREKIRTTLTILGIAVGVAVVVAIALSNQSALRAFRESVDAVAGRANYQIASDVGLDEYLLIKLQPLWREGLRFAPVIDIDGLVEPAQLPVRILAVDLFSDVHFREYRYASVIPRAEEGEGSPAQVRGGSFAVSAAQDDMGRARSLFRGDSLIVPASFAADHGLHLGSSLALSVLGRQTTMVVRGILQPRGLATAFNGAIVIVDIAAAQEQFGMVGRLTRIDLIVPDDRVRAEVARLIPANARLERPSRRNERVEKMLRAFRVNLFALAGVALLVGIFLVYNTVLISILRRRKDVGVMKTLGAAPAQVFRAFILEGLLFGAVGSALGIVLGDALAYLVLRLIGRTINALYVASQPEAIVLTPTIALVGGAVGMLLSLASAVQPSIEAAHVPPNLLIRGGMQQRVARPRRNALAAGALACFACGAASCAMPPLDGIAVGGYLAVLFVVVGFSLLSPMIVLAISSLLRRPLRAAYGIVGQLAAASIPASLRRTSIACAALAMATGMMIAVALMVGSFRETVRVWVDQTVSSDLWLRPAKGLTNADVALFPPSIVDELRRVPFIAAVDPVRGRDVTYGDSIIAVGSGDFDVARRFGNLPMVAPRSSRQALAEAVRRNGVFVSESFSLKFRRNVGDPIELPTVRGLERFPITGIYRDYSNDRGVVVMDRALFIRAFDDDKINTVILYLRRGTDPELARRRLESMFGPRYHAFAVLNREIRTEVMRIFDQTFVITYALLAVAVIVAVLGIVNTLAALILERTPELALLRILGLSREELRRMILLESSILGVIALVTGLAIGYVLSWILIYVINKQSFGWTIEFHAPVRLIGLSVLMTFLASVLAGILPSRLASRINLAAAMQGE
jgi:putative ABC transport system permease protein